MYQHHEESLAVLKEYFSAQKETLGIVFGGSVAKGTERPDSDLDAMIIVTEEAYERRRTAGHTAECLFDLCTYEGGYFDVKYMSKEYIQAAAEKGSEPTRNSFRGSRVIYSIDPEIQEIVSQIPVFQEAEYATKMLSFHANFSLNYYYFWRDCRPSGYMKIKTASEIVQSIYRMILQENRVLFQCHRRLEADVAALGGTATELSILGKIFSETLSEESCEDFVQRFLEISTYKPPENRALVGSRYLADFEQWWLNPRPLVAEW